MSVVLKNNFPFNWEEVGDALVRGKELMNKLDYERLKEYAKKVFPVFKKVVKGGKNAGRV